MSMKSKSLTFSNTPESFKKDLGLYNSINHKVATYIADTTKNLEDDYADSQADILLKAVRATGLSAQDIQSLVGALTYSRDLVIEFEDQEDDIIDDLKENGVLTQDGAGALLSSIKRLKEIGAWRLATEDSLADMMPIYQSSKFRVLIILQFNKSTLNSKEKKSLPVIVDEGVSALVAMELSEINGDS